MPVRNWPPSEGHRRGNGPPWGEPPEGETDSADGNGIPDAISRLNLVEAAPGLARIAATAWMRTASWTLGTSMRTSRRALDAARTGQPAPEVLQDIGSEVVDGARRLLGLVGDAAGGDGAPDGPPGATDARGAQVESEERLRERGAALLRQSADVGYSDEAHPAYARILGELAPDEARILRLHVQEGPQAAVDVRAAKALNMGSDLVAPGLTMIGSKAGCRHSDRAHAYLDNLSRLGLIWFSREPLPDPMHYQVLEAQPEVIEAMRDNGRTKTVRRSIHLTPFGEDFCEICLPTDVTGEMDALPRDYDEQEGIALE